ncbi:hypothetical protein ASPBRDRAFT_59179 [Aspergillus brasiliensis CBS 101740]|uniref:Uncharacterized protein n=1 Tax=Aspergillus brasiliensis (strain CBS 101740 / IMI 381727 / IBT 21946) TaxID=767769 RepID=A0A1L9U678_ASPBC|nr:hypothetical protein ASPBRDRAFT_59179 [Aspergillus brasiliensis CBS 101740]
MGLRAGLGLSFAFTTDVAPGGSGRTWGGLGGFPPDFLVVAFLAGFFFAAGGKGEGKRRKKGKRAREKGRTESNRRSSALPGPLQVWSARVPLCEGRMARGKGVSGWCQQHQENLLPSATGSQAFRDSHEAIPGPFSYCSAFWSDRNLPYTGYCMPVVIPSAVSYGKERVSARYPTSGHQVTPRHSLLSKMRDTRASLPVLGVTEPSERPSKYARLSIPTAV